MRAYFIWVQGKLDICEMMFIFLLWGRQHAVFLLCVQGFDASKCVNTSLQKHPSQVHVSFQLLSTEQTSPVLGDAQYSAPTKDADRATSSSSLIGPIIS